MTNLKQDNRLIPVEYSDGLRMAVVIGTLLVVMRHAFNLEEYYTDGSYWMRPHDLNCLIQLVINQLTAIAVPTFFLMSGFWFFRSLRGYTDIPIQLKKRAKSLLLPLVLWNALIIFLHWAFAKYLGWYPPEDFKSLNLLNNLDIRILSQLTYRPALGVFWYIRTLILFCLLSPVIFFTYQNIFRSIVVLLTAAHCWRAIDLGILSTEGFLFFYLGGLIAFHKMTYWQGYVNQSNRRLIVYWFIVVFFLICKILRPSFLFIWYFYILCTVGLFVITCMKFARNKCCRNIILWFAPHAFFIYAFHPFTNFVLANSIATKLPLTPWYSMLVFWMSCILGVLFPLTISIIMRKCAPMIHSILTGGR